MHDRCVATATGRLLPLKSGLSVLVTARYRERLTFVQENLRFVPGPRSPRLLGCALVAA